MASLTGKRTDFSRTFLMDSEMNHSFEAQDDPQSDDRVRVNSIAFAQMSKIHAGLAEKLYSELCSLSFGEYAMENSDVISHQMWEKLYEILVDAEAQTRRMVTGVRISERSQRYANEAAQVVSIMAFFSSLGQDEYFLSTWQTSLFSQLVIDDIEFRRVYALLLWAEKAIREQQFELGLGEKLRELDSIRCTRADSIMSFRAQGMAAPKGASVDLDQKGTNEDRKVEQNVINTLFQLVRCGERAKAAEIAHKVGLAPLAAQLHLSQLMLTPEEMPLEATAQNHATHKRHRRAAYFVMLQGLLDDAGKKRDSNDGHANLLAALRGSLRPTLQTAKTLCEKVWAFANAAVLARILAAEGAMKSADHERLFDVPTTAKSIIGELAAENEKSGEVIVLLKLIDALLNDDVDELFALAEAETAGFSPGDVNSKVNAILVDVFFHLIVMYYIQGYEKNGFGDKVVRQQFADLRTRVGTVSHRRMAAFYSRFLPDEVKDDEILATMKLVDSEQERAVFMRALQSADVDFGRYACTLIKGVRDEDDAGVATLDEQIEQWQWLLVGGTETVLAALEEANRLLRKCMIAEPWKEHVARRILREVVRFDVLNTMASLMTAPTADVEVLSLHDDVFDGTAAGPSTSSAVTVERVEHASNEFVANCTFMDLFNFCVAISVKLELALGHEPISDEELDLVTQPGRLDVDWEATLKLRARAEAWLREEAAAKREVDIQRRNTSVVQNIQHAQPLLRALLTNIGWRVEYFLAPHDDGDRHKSHRKELTTIRNRFVVQFVAILARASKIVGVLDDFFEFFDTIDSDDLALSRERALVLHTMLADLSGNEPEETSG